MLSLADISDARAIARVLEDRETARVGKLPIARQSLARRIGCAPGTLETLRKGRLKRVERWLHDKLEALLVMELELELRRLTHELELRRIANDSVGVTEGIYQLNTAIADAQIVASSFSATGSLPPAQPNTEGRDA